MIDGVLRLADRTVAGDHDAARRYRLDRPDGDARRARRRGNRQPAHPAPGLRRLDRCAGRAGQHARRAGGDACRASRVDIAGLTTPVPFVPEHTPVIRLIEVFRKAHRRIAVVVDEYGVTEGIVSATDVLESIAGALPELGELPGGSGGPPGRRLAAHRRHAADRRVRGACRTPRPARRANSRRSPASSSTSSATCPRSATRSRCDGMTFEVVDHRRAARRPGAGPAARAAA